MAHGAIHGLFLGDARLEALLGQRSQQRSKVIAPSPVLQRIECSSQGCLKHHRQGVVGVDCRLHAGQRILFCQLLFAERSPVRKSHRLLQAESSSLGMIIGRFIHRHAETLSQRRLFQRDGEGDERLVTLHRHPVSLCMKEGRLLFGFGQGAVGQRESHPYLHAPSAGAYHGRQCLRKQCSLRLDKFRFRQARKLVHFHQYDAVVSLELPSVCGVAILRYGIDARNLVQVDETATGPLQRRKTFSQ